MANEQNLKPFLTEEEAREKGRIGGIKSGEARRKKKEDIKTAKAIVEALFAEKIKDKDGKKKFTVKEVMIKKLVNKAVKDGSLTAMNMLLAIVGENPNKPMIDITGFNIVVADERTKELVEDV